MKEILYIQAGSLSNYTGTHFWNTQESYFTYEDSQDPLTTHDISFREGLTQTVRVQSWAGREQSQQALPIAG